MKIGIVCPYDMFGPGGVQEVVRASYQLLTERGHEVKIISPRPRRYKHKPPKDYILIGQSANISSIFKTKAQVSAAVDIDAIEQVLDTEKFDVLHFHEPWVPMVSRQILMRSKAKNIATFHAKLPDTLLSKSIEATITPYLRPMLQYFQAFTAVSEAAAAWTKNITNEPIVIIPNGIDLQTYDVPKLPSVPKKLPKTIQLIRRKTPRHTILYIGRLEKRKGVKYLIKAYQELRLKRDDVRLIIGGQGDLRASLEMYVRDNHIKDVTFLGFVSDKQKLALLREATVFCSPAIYGESFGIVLLEAMACGVVTVAGDNPGYATVMTDTGRLSLVDPKNEEEFVRRLDLLLDDETLRAVWLSWARTAIKQYDYNLVIDQYEKLYQDALS